MLMPAMLVVLACLTAAGEAEGELAAFVDGAVAAAMREHRVPGAVVAVVDRGGVLHGQGYGYADLKTARPVDFESTAFEVASVSKLFTAIAVMQLVESGQLALDVDVNAYLDRVRVPEAFDEPVTLGHLLTHTAGFDERAIGMATRDFSDAEALDEFVRRRLPPRVRAPGMVGSYSNMGFALAGLIVQEAAGQSFESYVEQRILAQLGMASSNFGRPPELRERLAKPYQFVDGRHVARPHNYMHGRPAGSLASTGSDMGRFMRACLNGGALDGSRILEADTLSAMQARTFTYHRGLPGMGMGFFRGTVNGKPVVSHDGYLRGFATALVLFPGEGWGLFVSNNGDSRAFNTLVLETVAERLAGVRLPDAPAPVIEGWEERVRPFLGAYRPARTGTTSLEKLASFMGQPRLRVAAPGVVRFGGQRWEEIEPGLFIEPYSGTRLALVSLPDERPLLVRGGWAFERLHWYETTLVQGALVAVYLLLFASAVLWPFGWIRRPQYIGLEAPGRFLRWAWVLPWAVALCNGVFLGGLLVALLGVDEYEFFLGLPPVMGLLLCLPLVSSVLLLALAPATVWVWLLGAWSVAGRVHYTVVALTAVAFVPFLLHWNLLGFHW